METSQPSPPACADRGFTLLEALVALAVLASGLAAVGQVGFTTVAAARHTQTRLFLAFAAREAFADMPDEARDGETEGVTGGLAWRLSASSFPAAPSGRVWAPEAVRLVVAAPSGGTITVDTVRLRRVGAR